MTLQYAVMMHFMSLFIYPQAQTFALMYLVVYSRYKEARDTVDLSSSLVLALYCVLKHLIPQTTK